MEKIHKFNLINAFCIFVIMSVARFVEDFYSPFAIEIMSDLGILKSHMQHSNSMYFAGFLFGTVVFGQLSDIIGRKPCVLLCLTSIMSGVFIFSQSQAVEIFYLGKFIQGFGSCIGSIVAQSICRDVYTDKELSKFYANSYYMIFIFSFIAIYLGGQLSGYMSWREVYLVILLFVGAIFLLNFFFLKETIQNSNPEIHTHKLFSNNFFKILTYRSKLFFITLLTMVTDMNILLRAIIIGFCASCNFGMMYEAPFFYIQVLKMTPQSYSLVYLMYGIGFGLIGFVNNFLLKRLEIKNLVKFTSIVVLFLSLLFLFNIFAIKYSIFTQKFAINFSLILQVFIITFVTVTSNNILTSSFKTKENVGITSSIFISMYYSVITFMIFLIGSYAPASLFSMPIIVLIFSTIIVFIVNVGNYFGKIQF